jgi:hypothetical protein
MWFEAVDIDRDRGAGHNLAIRAPDELTTGHTAALQHTAGFELRQAQAQAFIGRRPVAAPSRSVSAHAYFSYFSKYAV